MKKNVSFLANLITLFFTVNILGAERQLEIQHASTVEVPHLEIRQNSMLTESTINPIKVTKLVQEYSAKSRVNSYFNMAAGTAIVALGIAQTLDPYTSGILVALGATNIAAGCESLVSKIRARNYINQSRELTEVVVDGAHQNNDRPNASDV
ncbi:hypothetical protein K9K77_00355 [Candidatus Babeliales bacterium]|nr:hypothetical protein [Candidatus Babeliales bacterium]